MYDTVVIKSPAITLEQRNILLEFCKEYKSVDCSDGEIFYCFYSGQLDGSYDYRIRMNIDNREWVKPEGCQTPIAIETNWYVEVECSLHKLLMNHNCFGGPVDVKASIKYLINFIEKHASLCLPYYENWEVKRIDVSKIFVFQYPEICKRIIQNMQNGFYSRRKLRPYENGVMFAGSTTTDKFYWKGVEFKEHDYKRFNKYIRKEIDVMHNKENADLYEQRLIIFKRYIDEVVLNKAMRTLRFECEIKPRKLKELFGCDIVNVGMLKDDILHAVMETELRKCIKEDNTMDVVRRSDLVLERLNNMYNIQLSNCLYSVWAKLVQFGEKQVREEFPKSTFCRYKKQLYEAGVSWICSNVNLKSLSIVPDDFTFLDNKYVDDSVSNEVEKKLQEVA